jgi:hypothetical protein
MPNLLAFAKYVLHNVAVETLLMVIAIVMVIVLTIIVVIIMVMVIVIVIAIVLLHGCGEMAVIRYIIGNYKNETMSHQQQM